MATHKRVQIRKTDKYALCITRLSHESDKVVYIGCANKPVKYKRGNSKIIYIGLSKRGAVRIAENAVARTYELFKKNGFKYVHFYSLPCKKIRKLNTRQKVESALIEAFYQKFGELPHSNKNEGSGLDDRYFNEKHVKDAIDYYSNIKTAKLI